MRATTTTTAGLVLAMVLGGGVTAMAIEEADYRVVSGDGEFEIRAYEPQLLAETEVSGVDFEAASNVAFRRLFRYISGDNQQRRKVDMTAPVTQQPEPGKIAMTAPVTQQGVSGGAAWRVAFLVPSEYTIDTVPQPTDPAVTLRPVPARTLAAVRFSGTWSERRFSDREAALRQWLEERGMEPTGPAIVARYDPPFKPWFLRRNEILLPVAPAATEQVAGTASR